MTGRRQSVLYVPGSNLRALQKAAGLPADAFILDLEDAVAPAAKADARQHVCELVGSGLFTGREVAIRVNGLDTPWYRDDVQAVARAGPAAVVIPKASSVKDIEAVERDLASAGAPEHTRIWAMIETAAAVLAAGQIAAASPRLTVLVLGTNDLANELHAEQIPGRAPLLAALGLAVLAARAGAKEILDGVYNDVHDLTGFEAECRQARQFGFDGKTLVHPGQIEPCNRVLAPSAEQIAHSQAVIRAWAQATADGRAVATVNGRLIEHLHVENAHRILGLVKD